MFTKTRKLRTTGSSSLTPFSSANVQKFQRGVYKSFFPQNVIEGPSCFQFREITFAGPGPLFGATIFQVFLNQSESQFSFFLFLHYLLFLFELKWDHGRNTF